MGYESRIYVVEKNENYKPYVDKDYYYGSVVAMFDLCGMASSGQFLRLVDASRPTDTAIHVDGKLVVNDPYGEPLKEMTIVDVISSLEDEAATSDYRRLGPVIGLLRGFNEAQWQWTYKDEHGNMKSKPSLCVLHYGY